MHTAESSSLRTSAKQASTCLLLSIAIVATLGCASATATPDEGSAAVSAPQPRAVRTVAVRVGPLREVVRYVGTVRSHREVTVLAQLPGTLIAQPAREGETVEEGAVLARIASPETEARVARVQAELQRARTDSAWRCDRYQTDRRLRRSGAIPQAQLDQSRGACHGGRAAVRAAQAQLREMEALLAKAVERAPFAGRVLLWHGEPGENVLPGRPLLRLGDREREVLVRVAESDVRRGIRPGTAALLDLSPAAATPSSVTWVAPQTTGPARALDVVVALPPEVPDDLRHGMSVDVSFVLAEALDAVAVPERALQRGPDGDAILLVVGDRLERHPVVPGVRAEGWVAVEPPPPGESRVVVGGLETLVDGARVFTVSER